MSRFVPIAAKTAATRALAPSPTATIEMTEATPMMTPSAVRKLRVLFRISAPSAMGSTLREVHAALLGGFERLLLDVGDDLPVAHDEDARRVAARRRARGSRRRS